MARRLVARSLGSLAFLLILLALVEVLLRAAGLGPPPLFKLDARLQDQASVAVEDVDLIYRLRPGSTLLERYRINSLGYRGPDLTRTPHATVLRVVCIGDSSTFGLGVDEHDAWPFVLGRLLQDALTARSDPRRVEIIDAGVPGYTTLQNRAQITRDLLPLRPDAIVWCPMGHNDAASIAAPDELERWQARQGVVGWLRRLALVHGIGEVLASATLPDDGSLKVPRVSLDQLEQNLRMGARAARDAGVPLLLVVPPHDRRATVPASEIAAEGVVDRVARDEGLAVADPRHDIDLIMSHDPFPDDVHPDHAAHALIARHVFAALRRSHPEILDPRRTGRVPPATERP